MEDGTKWWSGERERERERKGCKQKSRRERKEVMEEGKAMWCGMKKVVNLGL